MIVVIKVLLYLLAGIVIFFGFGIALCCCGVKNPTWCPSYIASYKIDKDKALHSGAIHCYRTKEQAKLNVFGGVYRIFKVIGTECVAYNDKEIAFKKIEFVDDLSKECIAQ